MAVAGGPVVFDRIEQYRRIAVAAAFGDDNSTKMLPVTMIVEAPIERKEERGNMSTDHQIITVTLPFRLEPKHRHHCHWNRPSGPSWWPLVDRVVIPMLLHRHFRLRRHRITDSAVQVAANVEGPLRTLVVVVVRAFEFELDGRWKKKFR